MQLTLGIVAVAFAGIAAYFWWQGDRDTTFVLAVFAAASGFLSYRFYLKRRLSANQERKSATLAATSERSDQ
jgi:hypothetical protein